MKKMVRACQKNKITLVPQFNLLGHQSWGDELNLLLVPMWEASESDTHGSIDMINKTVVINNWHYLSKAMTPLIFATKGFDVMLCPWKKNLLVKGGFFV